jgi:hypothetical protein
VLSLDLASRLQLVDLLVDCVLPTLCIIFPLRATVLDEILSLVDRARTVVDASFGGFAVRPPTAGFGSFPRIQLDQRRDQSELARNDGSRLSSVVTKAAAKR